MDDTDKKRLQIYQKQLEREALDTGASRTRKAQIRAQEKERETTTETGRIALSGAIVPLAVGIDSWLWGKEAGFGKKYKKYFKLLSPELTALVIARVVVDGISKQRKRTAVAGAIGRAIQQEYQLQEFMKNHKGLATVKLKELATETDYMKERMILSEMRKAGIISQPWSSHDSISIGMLALMMMEKYTGMIKLYNIQLNKTKVGMVSATELMSEWLEESYNKVATMSMVYEPMVTKPTRWTNYYNGGYKLSEFQTKGMFVNDKGKHKDLEYPDNPLVFDAVNHLQETPWRVNTQVYDIITHLWENDFEIAGLPNKEFIPEPSKPLCPYTDKNHADLTPQEKKDKKTWSRYHRARKLTRRKNNSLITQRFKVHDNIMSAKKFKDFTHIYYPYHLDFRGRAYPFVKHGINPHGNDMSKGLLMFAEAKPISNFVQQSYYYVHGANMFGIKGTLDERVAWVEDNKEWLMRMGASPLEDTGWAKASKPFQFLAWLMDYVDYENYGAYHLSRIPVQMDGSCNGLQIISLITADNIIGEKTNCVPIKYPADVYGEVADNVITKLQNNPDNINLRLLRDYTIDRELMKKAVMTVPYGASYYTVFDLFYESFLNDCDMNVNKYSRVKRLATRLANVTWEVLKETLPTALEFREYLKDKIRRVIISGKEVSWVNPIGLRVHQGYRRQVKKRITTAIGKQFRRNTQYNEETDSLSIRDNLKGIVPNYIHSIDSSLMMLTTLAMKDKGITNLAMVHDSFATHACDAPELAKNLRQVASQIFSENLIKRFDMDIHDCYPEIQESQTPFKRGALDINQLTKSLYFFH